VSPDGESPYFQPGKSTKTIDLETHARATGRENLPETTARELSEAEAAVCRDHERQHLDLIERTRGSLRKLNATFDDLAEQVPCREDLAATVEDASNEVEHDFAATNFESLKQQQEQSRRDLRLFTRENGIRREAHYPDSWWLHLAMVGVIAVIESVANAGFFAEASPLGMLGGFWQAVAVSVVNVTSGFLAGYFPFRWRHHHRPALRQTAAVGIAIYVVFAIGFNWAVARYRDLVTVSGVSDQRLLDALSNDPLNLGLHSCALFALGLLASGLSAWKGYRADDPIPGYRDRDHRFRRASEALGHAVDGLRGKVLARTKEIPDRCLQVTRSAEGLLERMEEVSVEAVRAIERYESAREQIEDHCEVMLRKYREENRAIRTTPPPAYFESYPAFPSQVGRSVIEALERHLVTTRTQLDSLKAESRRIRIENPARVRGAGQRFENFLSEQLLRADANRGDGSGRRSAEVRS